MNRVQIVGNGEAEVKIYPIRRKTNRYRFFQLAWYELGQRRTKTFVDALKAKAYAQQIHVSLLNQGRVTEVTPQDIQMFRDAEAITAKFGVSLPFAIREWADARTLLGSAILGSAKSLADALHGVIEISVPAVVERFIESKRKEGMSKRHFQTLCTLLRPFAKRNSTENISSLTVTNLEGYIASQKGSARTKNNITASLKSLFNWAKRHSHLRADREPITDGLKNFKLASSAPEIFTPDQIKKILKATQENEAAMLPYMAIGAFAGLRSAEIGRLNWSAIDFNSGYIKIAGEITKTRQRRLVPISNNLRAWLLLHPIREGKIAPDNHRRGIARCAKFAKILWKSNALRHSFGSYRLAEVQDAAKVSLEMGNSPAMLFKHYRELVTPEQAREWFEIMPEMKSC